MTLEEMKARLKAFATKAGYRMSDETAASFLRSALVELHEQPAVDVDCSCDLCKYLTEAP